MTVAMPLAPDKYQQKAIHEYGPDAICRDCGKRVDDPIHTRPPRGHGQGAPKPGQGGGEPGTPTNDEPEDDRPGDQPDDDDPDSGDEPDDDDETGDGHGEDDEDEDEDEDDGSDEDDESEDDDTDDEDEDDFPQPKRGNEDEPLPIEAGNAASRYGVNIKPEDIETLQKAVEEFATLEGEDEHGRGQVLRNVNQIPDINFTRRNDRTHGDYQRASASIRAAFMRSKTGTDEFDTGYKHGRLAEQTLHRIAERGEDRLFGKRTAPSVARYNLWIMVDTSGSMAGLEIEQATDVAKAFATATAAIGSIRTSVWGWSSAYDRSLQNHVYPAFGAVRVYAGRGDPNTINDLRRVPMGGTPDDATLWWAIDAIRKDSHPSEQPIIVMVSDGQGADLKPVTDRAKKLGVRVIGVNIGDTGYYGGSRASQRDEHLAQSYGKDMFIGWQGSIPAMAGPLGRLIARIITPK